MPLSAPDKVVPFRHQVVQGAAGRGALDQDACLAEGDAAVHAARTLTLLIDTRQRGMELLPVPDPLRGFPVRCHMPLGG